VRRHYGGADAKEVAGCPALSLQTTDTDESLRMISCLKNRRRYQGTNTKRMQALVWLYSRPDRAQTSTVDSHCIPPGLARALVRLGYVRRAGGQPATGYRLTLYGKCKIVCDAFDVSLLGLCLVTEAYAAHKSQIGDGCAPSYVPYNLSDLLGGLYCHETVRRACSRICRAGLARNIRNGTIRLSDEAMDRLSEFEDVLADLHGWILSLPYVMDVLAMSGSKPAPVVVPACS